jgi:hypothetical protein
MWVDGVACSLVLSWWGIKWDAGSIYEKSIYSINGG